MNKAILKLLEVEQPTFIIEEELAVKTLRMIEQAKIPNISNRAKYTLKELESGSLNIYIGK